MITRGQAKHLRKRIEAVKDALELQNRYNEGYTNMDIEFVNNAMNTSEDDLERYIDFLTGPT